MTPFEIVNKFFRKKHKILDYYNHKVWFKIFLCENYETHASKTYYKFQRIYYDNHNLILQNYKGKEIKKLNRDNTVWISSIICCDKNMEFKIVDFNFVEIEDKNE